MLGVGWTEMLVIGVVALIVIGPKELPTVMRRVGQFAATIRKMGQEFQRELNKTTGLNEITNLRNSVTAPLKATADAIRKEITSTGTAPSTTPTPVVPFATTTPAPPLTTPQPTTTPAPVTTAPPVVTTPAPAPVAMTPLAAPAVAAPANEPAAAIEPAAPVAVKPVRKRSPKVSAVPETPAVVSANLEPAAPARKSRAKPKGTEEAPAETPKPARRKAASKPADTAADTPPASETAGPDTGETPKPRRRTTTASKKT